MDASSPAPPTPVPERLLAILQQLSSEELKSFQWYLKQRVSGGSSPIPVSRLENAKREDTVDQMVHTYREAGALEMTHHILRKIKRNDLAGKLKTDCKNSSGFILYAGCNHSKMHI